MDQSSAVCVIGPGRVGTSMTMRVLNLLGVAIGPEEGLVEPGPGGPKGFWERREIIKLNDRLLRLHGGSWRSPPRLVPGWEDTAELEPERERARALLAEISVGEGLWGWKDPRISLTTRFWRRLVPDLSFVICLRNPIDAADSLAPPSASEQDRAFYYARQNVAGERAYRLWMTYLASALVNTAGRPRLIVSYEEFFTDLDGVVERLARFVGPTPPEPGSEERRRIEEFIDGDLRHYSTIPSFVVGDPRLPAEVASLYMTTELLRAARAAPVTSSKVGFAELSKGVNAYANRLLVADRDRQEAAAASPALSG